MMTIFASGDKHVSKEKRPTGTETQTMRRRHQQGSLDNHRPALCPE
jgi:hypothetical protein